ncbi:MAG: hypothetical protein ACI8XU_000314, partial [Kiritimatiellia bacterium]
PLLDYCWTTVGLLLDYCWTTVGLLLDYCWTTVGNEMKSYESILRKKH